MPSGTGEQASKSEELTISVQRLAEDDIAGREAASRVRSRGSFAAATVSADDVQVVAATLRMTFRGRNLIPALASVVLESSHTRSEAMMTGGSRNVAAERGNIVGIAAMAILWITPTLRFWGAVFGPLRPYGYPAEDVAPSLVGFALGLAVCIMPYLLPSSYYRCWEGRRGPRVYGVMGVRAFKRFVPNGDLINRWARRLDPAHRMIRGEASALSWIDRTASETTWSCCSWGRSPRRTRLRSDGTAGRSDSP
jgi:hypothetical protein